MAKRKVKHRRKPEARKLPEYITFQSDKTGRRQMFIDGLPVRCGKKAREIEMQERDARGANPKDPRNCAFKRAYCRENPGADAVVFNSRVFLRPSGAEYWERMEMSQGMRLEAHTFDRGGRVAPGPQRVVPLSPGERERYEGGSRQGSAAPGARDRGSHNRTPSVERPLPHYVPDVRHWAAAPKQKKRTTAVRPV